MLQAQGRDRAGGSPSGVDGLFKKNKITRYIGPRPHRRARARSSCENGSASAPDSRRATILIATGSKVAPACPASSSTAIAIGTSTEALAYPEVPEHLVVIGAGVHRARAGLGVARLGAKVTVLEYLDRILPGMDAEIAAEAQRIFETQGLEFRLRSRVTAARVEGRRACVVEFEGAEPIRGDRVLVAVGRVARTPTNLGLESVGHHARRRRAASRSTSTSPRPRRASTPSAT